MYMTKVDVEAALASYGTAYKASRALGMPHQQLYNYMFKYGIPATNTRNHQPDPHRAEKEAELRKLMNLYGNASAVAKYLGCSSSVVYRKCHIYNIPVDNKRTGYRLPTAPTAKQLTRSVVNQHISHAIVKASAIGRTSIKYPARKILHPRIIHVLQAAGYQAETVPTIRGGFIKISWADQPKPVQAVPGQTAEWQAATTV